MKAYVLINVRAGKAREVVREIRPIEGVRSANACWGRPDTFTWWRSRTKKLWPTPCWLRFRQLTGLSLPTPTL